MTDLDAMKAEPWRFDFFDTLRRIERDAAMRHHLETALGREATSEGLGHVALSHGHARIGQSTSRREDYALLGQDPFFDFPASNLSAFSEDAHHRFSILVKFLGLLGPMGALPLATTEEAYAWHLASDDAFPRFLDIFNHRFLQLFFRAWADARPIVQHDVPEQDRFFDYIGSAVGLGSHPFQDLDSVPDIGKLAYAGLLGAKAMSASRLRGVLQGLFGSKVLIEEFIGSRLQLEPADRTLIGRALAKLGVDTMLGNSFYSVQDKIRIRIFATDMTHYARFLPDGDLCEKIVDIVFFCLGDEIEWDLELAIPAQHVRPGRLGASTQLGWTSWLSPDLSGSGNRSDARFDAAKRIQQKRSARPASL